MSAYVLKNNLGLDDSEWNFSGTYSKSEIEILLPLNLCLILLTLDSS